MIKIKPHHFVDIITRFGESDAEFQPHEYGHAVHVVANQVLSHRDTVLCIELGNDAICEPCCHSVNGACDDTIDISFRPQAPSSKQAYNLLIDQRWCQRLDLRQGDQLTARQFCERIRDLAGDLDDIYRETPVARTRTRQANLHAGTAHYLDELRAGEG